MHVCSSTISLTSSLLLSGFKQPFSGILYRIEVLTVGFLCIFLPQFFTAKLKFYFQIHENIIISSAQVEPTRSDAAGLVTSAVIKLTSTDQYHVHQPEMLQRNTGHNFINSVTIRWVMISEVLIERFILYWISADDYIDHQLTVSIQAFALSRILLWFDASWFYPYASGPLDQSDWRMVHTVSWPSG